MERKGLRRVAVGAFLGAVAGGVTLIWTGDPKGLDMLGLVLIGYPIGALLGLILRGLIPLK